MTPDLVNVADDPKLQPEEKEVILRWSRADDRVSIHAEQSTVVKWLLRHPEFSEEWRREKDGVLHAISGTLPVGAMKLSGNPRKSNNTASVLGKFPEDRP